ncbi:YcxB family protein [Winogradskyella eckloniae]|uniref:YcxB family protein n=1 Tax=Winogradskyella eckloniae TaxID=1089306 RepID=UPI00156712C1|nr:YcxB family protein [Winogradskyella eckloniae]NRD20952.1 YcxB family protein [Winogradskyella eckloniae]
MKLEYTLNFSDFLEYQLYVSSKSELHKKNRNKSRIVVPIIYIILGAFILFIKKTELAIAFFGFAVLWFLFYPLYSKWKYKKHFEKHIKENYKNRIGKKATLNFDKDADFIEASDFGTQTKIQDSEFDKLIELKDYYFLRLKSELSLIIPKRAVSDQEKFKKLFSDINLEYVNELNWEWK